MRSFQFVGALASLSHVLAVPVEGNAQFQVGSAVFLDPQGSVAGNGAFNLGARDVEERQIRSTSMGMNPSKPTSRTTTTTRTTTRTTTKAPVTTTTTTTTTPPKTIQTLNVSGMTYLNAMLQSHNIHRPNHTESNLVWDQALANTAQKIASSCVYQHDTATDGGGYGQNIGAGAAGNAAAGLITNLMYNGEINNFPAYGVDNIDMSNFGSWGHYSQLAWADTTNVGCATVYCPQGLKNTGSGVAPYFTVCNYKPPGNYIGQFSKVKKPQGGNTYVVVGS